MNRHGLVQIICVDLQICSVGVWDIQRARFGRQSETSFLFAAF